VGEHENPLIDVHSAELVHRISGKRPLPAHGLAAQSQSHIDHRSLNTAEEEFGTALLDFIAHPR